MKIRVSSSLLIALVVSYAEAHAEGGCPDGMYPQSGQGWQTCVPIPGYGSQQNVPQKPQPMWESRWGAIATDGARSALGTSQNALSRRRAEKAALSNCKTQGGVDCKLQVSYDNSCGVMVVGNNGFNISTAATLNQATDSATRICRADGDTGCHVYYSDCSLPVRVQ